MKKSTFVILIIILALVALAGLALLFAGAAAYIPDPLSPMLQPGGANLCF